MPRQPAFRKCTLKLARSWGRVLARFLRNKIGRRTYLHDNHIIRCYSVALQVPEQSSGGNVRNCMGWKMQPLWPLFSWIQRKRACLKHQLSTPHHRGLHVACSSDWVTGSGSQSFELSRCFEFTADAVLNFKGIWPQEGYRSLRWLTM